MLARRLAEAQVVVIGAGVIGSSIAYHLARRNASVIVIDAGGIATGTSSATLGLVWVQRKEPVEYMELNYLSAKLHAQLAGAFDEDVELNQPGGIATYLDEAAFHAQIEVMERLNAASPFHQARAITTDEARRLEPALSPEIIGAIYCPHDGEINPIKLTFNFARQARKFGAQFLLQTPVQRIIRDEAGVTGVETSNGMIRAGAVVVAAGMGTAGLVQPLGIDLPVKFERGQLLVTEATPRVMIHPTGNTRQTARGNILIGVTYEMGRTERLTTLDGVRKIYGEIVRRYPVMKDANIIRHFAGIRPLPQDGKPYLGPVRRVPGLYVAASHSGITLSAVHGKVISELILDGHSDVPIESYRPERHMAELCPRGN